MILFLFLLPLLKGNTGVSFPVDFLDRYITNSFTQPQEKFGFFFELPSYLRYVSVVYRNFAFTSDGQSFVGIDIGTYAEKASISIRSKYMNIPDRDGIGLGLGFLQAPSRYFSFGVYSEVNYFFFERVTILSQIGVSFHKTPFAINIEPYFSPESLGLRMGGTYIFKFFGNRILRSVKLLLGVDILERIIPSAGIRASIKIFDFWFGFSEKKILFGFSVNYKKRIEIKEIVKKVEVIKEVPVYVEKKEKKVIRKKRKKRKTKEKEKKPAISEQELEVYYIKGIEYYKREMLEEALKEWEKIMNLNPDYKDVKELYEKTKKRLERLRRLSE